VLVPPGYPSPAARRYAFQGVPPRKSLVTALKAHWKPGWSQAVEMNVRNGDNEMLGIPNEVILPLLDRDQADVWKHLPKLPDANPKFDPERMGSVGTPINDPEIDF